MSFTSDFEINFNEVTLLYATWRFAKSDSMIRISTDAKVSPKSGYAGLGKRGYEHFAVAECGDPEVAEQYLPIIHLVFANLKTWLIGIHHGVSHQHLQAYLNEFTFRFNRLYPFNAFRSLLGIAGTPLLQPMPSFTRESGGTLHVAVMGVNRIGKLCSTIEPSVDFAFDSMLANG